MKVLAVLFCFLVAACSSDTTPKTDTGVDPDAAQEDATTDAGPTEDVVKEDLSTSNCETVIIPSDAFRVGIEDDVSIEYYAPLDTEIANRYNQFSMLFERYSPLDDVGTFDLSVGQDNNFGGCQHCVYIRGTSRERVLYADRGSLTIGLDPYSRKLDVTLEGARLIEVEVDPVTRQSTPVPDGLCVEVETFSAEGNFPPALWLCDEDKFGDGTTCDCECGVSDPDCGGPTNCLPGDPNCGPYNYPIADCEAEEICAFAPDFGTTRCTSTCDWQAGTACADGTCVFSQSFEQEDTCITNPDRVSTTVRLGDLCPTNNFQIVCEVVDGFAQGYCGPANICRPVCESDAECPVADETCRRFFGNDGLGYCGPEPMDG